jgi:hypothetical protein
MSISSTIENFSPLSYGRLKLLSSDTLASPVVDSFLPEKAIFRDFETNFKPLGIAERHLGSVHSSVRRRQYHLFA